MKPPTWEQLQALMPWAHIECSERGEAEIIIYTGLTLNDDDEVVWMHDMEMAMED